MTIRVIAGVLGIVILALIGRALLLELLVPRPTTSVLTHLIRVTTQAMISLTVRVVHQYPAQHRYLTGLGPMIVVGTLFVAVMGFLVGFALVIYALDGGSATQALLQAGSALLTLGIVQVVDPGQVLVTLVAAFTGMVIIAVLVGYLLLLFTAYNAREAGVTKSAMWAGEPAWGPELLCRRALAGNGPLDPQADGWIDWVCELRVGQTTYPVLAYFRSAGPLRGWPTTLVARLDAACLELAIVRHKHPGDLSALLAEGVQTMAVLRHNLTRRRRGSDGGSTVAWPPLRAAGMKRPGEALYRAIRTDGQGSTRFPDHPADRVSILSREEFDRAVELLQAAGIELRDDRDGGWERFRELRGQYEDNAYVIAERVHAVPAPWTGARRVALPTIWPTVAVELLDDAAGTHEGPALDAGPS